MKKTQTMKRFIIGFLTVMLVIFSLSVDAFRAGASSLDFSIDDSGFVNPDIKQQTVWYWHKGLPPADGNEYPVLLCWDDKYGVVISDSFIDSIYAGLNHDRTVDNSGGLIIYTRTNGSYGPSKDKRYPLGSYNAETAYSSGWEGLLTNLDFNYEALRKTGSAVSITRPRTLVMKAKAPDPDAPPEPKPDDGFADYTGYEMGFYSDEDHMLTWKNDQGNLVYYNEVFIKKGYNALIAQKTSDFRVWTEYEEVPILPDIEYRVQKRVFSWYLNPLNADTYTYSHLFRQNFYALVENVSSGKTSALDYADLTWQVSQNKYGKYFFYQRGITDEIRYSTLDTDVGGKDAQKAVRYVADTRPGIRLSHIDNCLHAEGDYSTGYHTSDLDSPMNARYGFDVYYAEPNLMYFQHDDIFVQKGQVTNLDGPLCIAEGTTVTVENGGVLTLSDWVINNGQILVEPGGTLLVQKAEKMNGQTTNGVIANWNTVPGSDAGRISCDGTMIIMPDCTVNGGGIYGVEFGEGAQCVNYGALISENLTVYTDRTIENRGDKSVVYAGYSIMDSGFSLINFPVTTDRDSFVYGTMEDTASINMPQNAVYGKSSSHFYINSAGSITKNTNNPVQKGRVTPVR